MSFAARSLFRMSTCSDRSTLQAEQLGGRSRDDLTYLVHQDANLFPHLCERLRAALDEVDVLVPLVLHDLVQRRELLEPVGELVAALGEVVDDHLLDAHLLLGLLLLALDARRLPLYAYTAVTVTVTVTVTMNDPAGTRSPALDVPLRRQHGQQLALALGLGQQRHHLRLQLVHLLRGALQLVALAALHALELQEVRQQRVDLTQHRAASASINGRAGQVRSYLGPQLHVLLAALRSVVLHEAQVHLVVGQLRLQAG